MPWIHVPASRTAHDLLWGQVWLYDYAEFYGNGRTNIPHAGARLAQYDYQGNLGQYIPGYAPDPNPPYGLGTPAGWFPVSYDKTSDGLANAESPIHDRTYLIPKVERTTVYADGDLKLGDSVTAYGEVLLNRRKTTVHDYRQFWTYMYNSNFSPCATFCADPVSRGRAIRCHRLDRRQLAQPDADHRPQQFLH